jgi:hypothetical protein
MHEGKAERAIAKAEKALQAIARLKQHAAERQEKLERARRAAALGLPIPADLARELGITVPVIAEDAAPAVGSAASGRAGAGAYDDYEEEDEEGDEEAEEEERGAVSVAGTRSVVRSRATASRAAQGSAASTAGRSQTAASRTGSRRSMTRAGRSRTAMTDGGTGAMATQSTGSHTRSQHTAHDGLSAEDGESNETGSEVEDSVQEAGDGESAVRAADAQLQQTYMRTGRASLFPLRHRAAFAGDASAAASTAASTAEEVRSRVRATTPGGRATRGITTIPEAEEEGSEFTSHDGATTATGDMQGGASQRPGSTAAPAALSSHSKRGSISGLRTVSGQPVPPLALHPMGAQVASSPPGNGMMTPTAGTATRATRTAPGSGGGVVGPDGALVPFGGADMMKVIDEDNDVTGYIDVAAMGQRDLHLQMPFNQALLINQTIAALETQSETRIAIRKARRAARLHAEAAAREKRLADELAQNKASLQAEFNFFRMRMLGMWLFTNALLTVLMVAYDPNLMGYAQFVAACIVYVFCIKLMASLVYQVRFYCRASFRRLCRCCYRIDRGETGIDRVVCCSRPLHFFALDDAWEMEHNYDHAYPEAVGDGTDPVMVRGAGGVVSDAALTGKALPGGEVSIAVSAPGLLLAGYAPSGAALYYQADGAGPFDASGAPIDFLSVGYVATPDGQLLTPDGHPVQDSFGNPVFIKGEGGRRGSAGTVTASRQSRLRGGALSGSDDEDAESLHTVRTGIDPTSATPSVGMVSMLPHTSTSAATAGVRKQANAAAALGLSLAHSHLASPTATATNTGTGTGTTQSGTANDSNPTTGTLLSPTDSGHTDEHDGTIPGIGSMAGLQGKSARGMSYRHLMAADDDDDKPGSARQRSAQRLGGVYEHSEEEEEEDSSEGEESVRSHSDDDEQHVNDYRGITIVMPQHQAASRPSVAAAASGPARPSMPSLPSGVGAGMGRTSFVPAMASPPMQVALTMGASSNRLQRPASAGPAALASPSAEATSTEEHAHVHSPGRSAWDASGIATPSVHPSVSRPGGGRQGMLSPAGTSFTAADTDVTAQTLPGAAGGSAYPDAQAQRQSGSLFRLLHGPASPLADGSSSGRGDGAILNPGSARQGQPLSARRATIATPGIQVPAGALSAGRGLTRSNSGLVAAGSASSGRGGVAAGTGSVGSPAPGFALASPIAPAPPKRHSFNATPAAAAASGMQRQGSGRSIGRGSAAVSSPPAPAAGDGLAASGMQMVVTPVGPLPYANAMALGLPILGPAGAAAAAASGRVASPPPPPPRALSAGRGGAPARASVAPPAEPAARMVDLSDLLADAEQQTDRVISRRSVHATAPRTTAAAAAAGSARRRGSQGSQPSLTSTQQPAAAATASAAAKRGV